jgi:aromatic ring-opening dioxygenase catalytic subunit (LigB family)
MPTAFVVISAHNVNDAIEITAGNNHGSRYTGHPQLAKKIEGLLNAANIKTRMMQTKKWDFATTHPMMAMNSKGKIPLVSVSLHQNLSAKYHLKLGQALSSLRAEGVMIIGSGASYHNFDYLFSKVASHKQEGIELASRFDNALNQCMTSPSISS